jgi:PKD repeat protein
MAVYPTNDRLQRAGRKAWRVRRMWWLLTAVAVSALLALTPTASADPGDIGYLDGSFEGAGSNPTGQKRPESALWWNDGHWWASMWDTASQDFHIFKLDRTTQTWSDTGVPLDTRSASSADTLWDGSHLYVSSHKSGAPAAGFPSYLWRFSYDPATDRYTLDPGFPVQINNYRSETLTIDKDSTGKLWATWMQDKKIYVNRTVGDDRTWGTPFVLPVNGVDVTADDLSSLVAFGGDKIGVMWSNQNTASDGMYFAVHQDGQPDTAWEGSRTAIQGPGTADDHINLKSLQSDGSGRVFAAVKTSHTSASAPLIMLLVRDPATGDWTSHVVGRVSECHNRPMVVIDEAQNLLHVFAAAPQPPGYACDTLGGTIYEKTSPLNSISFERGYGTPVIRDADSPAMNNVTSTKQTVTAASGLLVLAVNRSTFRYWHHYDPLGASSPPPPPPPAPSPPTADFTATPTSGEAPLAVQFSDASIGNPTSWSWDFGDGTGSNERNPNHTYSAPGSYTVTLTATNADGSDTETRSGHITATAPPPPPEPPPNVPLFSEGFESGNLSQWTGGSGLIVQQGEVFSGAWAARGTSTGQPTYAYKSLAASQAELYYQVRLKRISQGSTSVALLKFRTATGVARARLYLTATGKLATRNDVTGATTTSSTAIAAGRWYTAQVHLLVNGTSSRIDVWLDGARVDALSKTDSFGSTPIGRIELGDDAENKNYDLVFDDVVVDTAAIP